MASGITSKARATSRLRSVGAACRKQLKCKPTQISEVTGIDETRESLACASPHTKSTADQVLELSRSPKHNDNKFKKDPHQITNIAVFIDSKTKDPCLQTLSESW